MLFGWWNILVLMSKGDVALINYHDKCKSHSFTPPQHLSIAGNNETVPTWVVQNCVFSSLSAWPFNPYPANVDNMASSYQCQQMADGI